MGKWSSPSNGNSLKLFHSLAVSIRPHRAAIISHFLACSTSSSMLAQKRREPQQPSQSREEMYLCVKTNGELSHIDDGDYSHLTCNAQQQHELYIFFLIPCSQHHKVLRLPTKCRRHSTRKKKHKQSTTEPKKGEITEKRNT